MWNVASSKIIYHTWIQSQRSEPRAAGSSSHGGTCFAFIGLKPEMRQRLPVADPSLPAACGSLKLKRAAHVNLSRLSDLRKVRLCPQFDHYRNPGEKLWNNTEAARIKRISTYESWAKPSECCNDNNRGIQEHMMTDEGRKRFDKSIKRHLGTKKEQWKRKRAHAHTQQWPHECLSSNFSKAPIGCGGLISTAQPLILHEDIGLIVELWMDKLSSPTPLPPPRRELSQTGERVWVQPRRHPLELGLKSPAVPQPADRRRPRQALGQAEAEEDVFVWPGKGVRQERGTGKWGFCEDWWTKRGSQAIRLQKVAQEQSCTWTYVGRSFEKPTYLNIW